MPLRSSLTAGFLLFALGTSALADLHVSPTGSDHNRGTPMRPLASLGRALELAATGSDKLVILLPGRHRLTHGLMLDSRHDGISIQGHPGAILTGSMQVVPSQVESVDSDLFTRLPGIAKSRTRQIRVDRLGLTARDFQRPRGFAVTGEAPCELVVGDQAQELARWPNDGMTRIAKVVEGGDVPREGRNEGKAPVVQIDSTRPSTWGPGDLWAYGYWKWDWADESISVARVEGATIALKGPHHYGVAQGQPIRFENVLEELDRPGECAIVGNRLVFWPSSRDRRIEISRVTAPLLKIHRASNLRIQGLTFENTRGQALDLQDATQVTVRRCVFRNLGLHAASTTGGKRIAFEGCTVEDTGEGGFFLNCGDRAALTPAAVRVQDCVFRRFMRRARTYRPAVRLDGVGITITRCDFRDAPHSAIIFSGNDHLIERNRFADLLSETGDGGVVYGGRDWTARGTVIRENLFVRVRGMRKWENAVYLDDQLSGITVERNVFVDCHWAMLIGGGRENVVRDNLLLGCTLGFSTDARGLGWAASTLSTLKERLAAVPATREPWRSRYPDLVGILDDQPMAPLRNILEGNVLVRSGKFTDRLDATFTRLGTVRDNPSLSLSGWWLTSTGFDLGEALREVVAERSSLLDLTRVRFGPGPAPKNQTR